MSRLLENSGMGFNIELSGSQVQRADLTYSPRKRSPRGGWRLTLCLKWLERQLPLKQVPHGGQNPGETHGLYAPSWSNLQDAPLSL